MSISRFNAVEKASNRKAVEAVTPKQKVSEYYGENVFNRKAMQKYLSKETYKALTHAIDNGTPIDREIANHVAAGMRMWALEKGVTHYTHWFQPLTGITAEKHESFIGSPDAAGKIIMDLSGKELIKGEPDASSFPSGGLRATFEARGYTAWDCTSPAFLKKDATGVTLCIPTAFCSYRGEALDKKTPLLRSMEALDKQAIRIFHLFGNTAVKRVVPSVGPEQEYFLVDREKYLQRKDLIYTGRTLFGAMPPKGQEMDDHYYGVIRERIGAYMKEINEELWKLGVSAKTQHNEVAPAQHELAPIFSLVNVAADHNQLTMEILKKTASKHGFACLLHEKPFDGVNGSGKHNNWSLSTNTGVNLLDPDREPAKNLQFMLFLAATMKAVDVYGDLLRVSVATAGNDHRLGGNEAPPAIVSMFIGDDLASVLDIIEADAESEAKETVTMTAGPKVLPHFIKDTTDRNRTSPFAFTGNKFEFRMPGCSLSVSGPNVILNTAVADSLGAFADRLEKVPAGKLEEEIHTLLKEVIRAHRRIVFNGNGYTEDWVKEAGRRGLFNLPACADAFPCFIAEKNIALFTKHHVFTREEIFSRYEIMQENYVKTINIEAKTMCSMMYKTFLPSLLSYIETIAEATEKTKKVLPSAPVISQEKLLSTLARLYTSISEMTEELKSAIAGADSIGDFMEKVRYFNYTVLAKMNGLRSFVDEAEALIPESFLTYPTYDKLLFSI